LSPAPAGGDNGGSRSVRDVGLRDRRGGTVSGRTRPHPDGPGARVLATPPWRQHPKGIAPRRGLASCQRPAHGSACTPGRITAASSARRNGWQCRTMALVPAGALVARLREAPGRQLILAGFMTHMCVNSTARGAFNLGYHPTVVASALPPDSCPDLTVFRCQRRRCKRPASPRSPTSSAL